MNVQTSYALLIAVICTLNNVYHVRCVNTNRRQQSPDVAFLRGSNSKYNVNENIGSMVPPSPPLAVMPMESKQDTFRFSQRGLMLKSMSSDANNEENSVSTVETSTVKSNISETGSSATGNGEPVSPKTGVATGSADDNESEDTDESETPTFSKKNVSKVVKAATGSAHSGASGPARSETTRKKKSSKEVPKKAPKKVLSNNDDNTTKILKDLNKDLPSENQFLTQSKDAEQVLNEIAVEDTNSTTETVAIGAATGSSNQQPPLKVSNRKESSLDPSEYEPQNIPELGGSIMVHKESKLPVTYSPIVMPTVQEVGTLKEIKEVRTPVGHVPANYNGTFFKKLDVHPTTIHVGGNNKLFVPLNLPKDENKKNPFAISSDIKEWKADAKRLLNWASVEEKHLHLNDATPSNVYDNVQKDSELHLFGRENMQ